MGKINQTIRLKRNWYNNNNVYHPHEIASTILVNFAWEICVLFINSIQLRIRTLARGISMKISEYLLHDSFIVHIPFFLSLPLLSLPWFSMVTASGSSFNSIQMETISRPNNFFLFLYITHTVPMFDISNPFQFRELVLADQHRFKFNKYGPYQ